MNPDSNVCPDCGHTLTNGGLCSRCLLRLGKNNGEAPSLGGKRSPAETTPHLPLGSFPLTEIARLFPQYEILELIGRGGMGTVYKARQVSLDRLVAIKLIEETEVDPTFAERFSREAKALARLSNPNIVTVHDFGQIGAKFYLVMEYVEGMNLRQAIDLYAFEPTDALRIVEQVCQALQYAHSRGVVHRDIKPENILLTEEGTAKIADFGLAKLLDANQPQVSLTATRQVMGTLAYMAPEQIEGAASVDHRADIYSLGVVFYELLTGHLPLGRFDPPSHSLNSIDKRIDPVVMKSLSRHPRDRYQAAADLASDVANLSSTNIDAESVSYDALNAYAATAPAKDATAYYGAAADKQFSSADLEMSIPFKVKDLHLGFATAVGVVHGGENMLRIEWKVRDNLFNVIESKLHSIEVPFSALSKLQLRDYGVALRLRIKTRSLETLGSLPQKEPCTATLTIARADAEELRWWIERQQQMYPEKFEYGGVMGKSSGFENPLNAWLFVAGIAGLVLVSLAGLKGILAVEDYFERKRDTSATTEVAVATKPLSWLEGEKPNGEKVRFDLQPIDLEIKQWSNSAEDEMSGMLKWTSANVTDFERWLTEQKFDQDTALQLVLGGTPYKFTVIADTAEDQLTVRPLPSDPQKLRRLEEAFPSAN